MRIGAFLKFGELAHLETLRSGVLYMNTLDYFQKLEADEAKRADRFEGVTGVFQPDQITLKLSFNGETHEFTDLAGPIILGHADLSDIHAFCLFAVTPGEYEVEDEIYEGNFLKVRLNPANEEFGGYILFIKDVNEFINRLREALKRHGRRARAALVEYIKESEYHGHLPEGKVGLFKFDTFKHQQEFRVIIYNSGSPNVPLRLEIGDLSDITEIYPWSAFDMKIKKNDP
ncbi:hypothetical protein [Bdellovibrio sp.]|uniref:hypothetical protein n=1 Tax=Bdellovibrio sp. TaxID=28201 RepID=UPI0032219BB8